MNPNRDIWKSRLKWAVANKELTKINAFTYASFKFSFNIMEQELMEEFSELVTGDKLPLPEDVCNFLIKRRIYYKLRFVYVKEIGWKKNLRMLIAVNDLNKSYHKYLKQMRHWIFKFEFKKKQINGKLRNDLIIQLINNWKGIGTMLQADSNIWWKPKKIKIDNEYTRGTSVGWLFAQVARYRFKSKPLTVPSKSEE